MSQAARHRQAAREHEQRENWKRAIEAYEQAIVAEKRIGRDVDLALYNRVGDLYRRIGDVNRAVHYYELAADGHLAAGFYNNAIALCNKILRNQPNRHSAYLKLGKIGAAKGFLSDARRHFLEYADRMQRVGQLDEAFSALIEFADLSPDPEVRLMIADQLLDHGRKLEAVEQLRLGWRDLTDDNREADARQVRSTILDLAPKRDPEVDPPEPATATAVDAEGVIDLPEILPYDEPEEAQVVEEAAESGLADLDLEIERDEAEDLVDVEFVPEELDVTQTSLGGELEPEDVADGEDIEILPTALQDEGSQDAGPLIEPEEEIEPTSLVGEKEDEALDLEADQDIVPTSLAEEERTEPGGASGDVELGELDWEEPPPESSRGEVGVEIEPVSLDLPEGLVVEAEAAPAEDSIVRLERRMETEGRRPELLVELADALLDRGERDRATIHLEEALARYEEESRYSDAERVIDELLHLDVNHVRAYQKRIELAVKVADRRALIEAYLDLADCLDRTDSTNKAKVVYQRVLELDPGNRRAATALDMFGDEAVAPMESPSQPATEKAAGEDRYVDLGSLILEEKAQSRSTRFTVPAADPQSEDEVNFSDMLKQFKSKVEEAIEKEDAASHYDLGVAYKEMGLIDEAIAEFQIAARGLDYRLRAIEMLGACFIDKEDYRIALKVLRRALQGSHHTDEDLVGIFYAMGRAYEALDETGNALESYERVMGCDVHFKDVASRVATLRQ